MIVVTADPQSITLIGKLQSAQGRLQIQLGTLGAQVIPMRVTTMEQAVRGPAGTAKISDDPDNRLKRGSDNGLHVLDGPSVDLLAYYILAKG